MRSRLLLPGLFVAAGLAPSWLFAQQPGAWTTASLAEVETVYPDARDLYLDLHRNPELAFQETRTAAALAAWLKPLGFEVTTGVARTGVVGVLRNGAGPTVMLRTEIDALPVKENTGLPFASTVVAKNAAGDLVPVMHACGHDLHMAAWAGTARLMAEHRTRWRGTLVMVGQPAEESGGGALAMIQDGLFTRFPRPDFALSLHDDDTMPAGTIGYRAGFFRSMSDAVTITVFGRGGHGAMPFNTIDPIVLASRIVLSLQTIVSRESNPNDPVVVTVGSIHGGTQGNVIPSEVRLQLTVRTYTPEVRTRVLGAIRRIARGEAEAAGAPREPQVDVPASGNAPVFNDPALTNRLAAALKRGLGEASVVEMPPKMTSEDFAEYGRAGIPAALLHIGAVNASKFADAKKTGIPVPPPHSPEWAPDLEPTLKAAIRAETTQLLELFGGTAAGAAQNAAPPLAQFPPRGTGLDAADRARLQVRVDALAAAVASLKATHRTGFLADRVADVEVYLDAVRRPLKYDERLFAGRGSAPAEHALQTLTAGDERAAHLRAGRAPWMNESGVRGFYSHLDGSAQPYLLTLPDRFDPALSRRYRLDVFLHGRDDTVLEQQFMAKSLTGYASKPFRAGDDRFMVQPYGRYTNANRFAGEIDGLEAIESVRKAYPIDADRIVMAGFSMGGASAWQYGMHYADRWVAVAPGAGFTETAIYLRSAHQRQPQNAVQRRLWHLYDSTDYAANAFNVPVVAYSGEIDPQKQAADAMAAAMQAEGLTLEHIIGPGTGHSYEAAARQRLQDRIDRIAEQGRTRVPREIRFTTWTLRYNRMFWIGVQAMGEMWERARVDARVDDAGLTIATTNVAALDLTFAAGEAPWPAGVRPALTIDGAKISLPAVARDQSLAASLIRTNGRWRPGTLPTAGLRKVHGLQGPIDDAYMDAFMIVRPTGRGFAEPLDRWTRAQADDAISRWTHFFRGEPRVKDDVAVTDGDIAANHLILFGDPASNAVYRRIARRLPITWEPDGVRAGDERFPSTHAPVFIFPNPLNPKKYVVINSGFTFHDHTSNAMQSPKLPDWAIVDITKPGNNYRYSPLYVASQGFFDETWRLKGPMAP